MVCMDEERDESVPDTPEVPENERGIERCSPKVPCDEEWGMCGSSMVSSEKRDERILC